MDEQRVTVGRAFDRPDADRAAGSRPFGKVGGLTPFQGLDQRADGFDAGGGIEDQSPQRQQIGAPVRRIGIEDGLDGRVLEGW